MTRCEKDGRLSLPEPMGGKSFAQARTCFRQGSPRGLRVLWFFYAGPNMLLPAPDGLFVAIPIALVGLLATPAHGTHQFPDIRYGIPDAKLRTDNLPDSTQCPQVGGVSRFQRTLKKQSRCALPLGRQRSSPRGRLPRNPRLPWVRNDGCRRTTEFSEAPTVMATSRYGLPDFKRRMDCCRGFSSL